MSWNKVQLMATRRSLLGGLALGGATGLGIPSGLASRAKAEEGGDYRALVCVMLEGGSDNWSTLVPFDATSHASYQSARPDLAIGQDVLAPTQLQPINDLGGFAYALNPRLQPLLEIFNAGDLAIIQNIGALVAPTTASMFQNGNARLPSRLFSHNLQREFVLTGSASGATTGWGGRIGDLVSGSNHFREFTCINAARANTTFLTGNAVMPYAVDDAGAKLLLRGREDALTGLLKTITTASSDSVFRQEYANIMQRAFFAGNLFASQFARVADSNLSDIPIESNDLGRQLRAVARTIASAPAMGMRRQVFFVMLRNWDAHNATADTDGNFTRLASALHGFWRVMQRWGKSDEVTTFTLSDFGRTLNGNGNGTDHGWGSAQFVMGGAVNGGRVLGTPPLVGTSSPDTILGGRLVPTTPVDSLAASLATWMGVDDASLTSVVNNLVNFAPEARDLGLFV